MRIILFLTFLIPIYITFRLLIRIIYGLIHYEKKIFAILILMLICFFITPIREFLFANPNIIFIVFSLSFICEVLLLLVDSILFKIKKKKGYYNKISTTVTNIERRFEFVKHDIFLFGTYYFPHVSYKINDEMCYYSIKNGFKNNYKIDDSIILYQDPSTGKIIEDKEKNNNIILSFQLLIFGVYFLFLALGIMN